MRRFRPRQSTLPLYVAALSTLLISQETGGELKPHEITLAYQFGKEATIPNVLEKNYWEDEEEPNGSATQMDVEGGTSQQPKVVARTRVSATSRTAVAYSRFNSQRRRSTASVL